MSNYEEWYEVCEAFCKVVMTVDDIMYYSLDEKQRVIVYRLDDDETLFDGYMDDDEYDSVMNCEISTWDITTHGAICFNI